MSPAPGKHIDAATSTFTASRQAQHPSRQQPQTSPATFISDLDNHCSIVGDTIDHYRRKVESSLPGYEEATPMVFCVLFPVEADQFPQLRDALEKLHLNDAALKFETERSSAMCFGFRCGFLGLLHMEIVYELPLAEMVDDFFDQLKYRSKDYASMEYSLMRYRESDLSKHGISINNEHVEALASIVHKDKAYTVGRALTQI